jgi:hypothetical protein
MHDAKLRGLKEGLEEKNRQIVAAYASATGRHLANLSDAELTALAEEVDDMIEQAEEALADGDTPEDWQAHEEKLAATSVGRLILERHEIEQQLLNELDDQTRTRKGHRHDRPDGS